MARLTRRQQVSDAVLHDNPSTKKVTKPKTNAKRAATQNENAAPKTKSSKQADVQNCSVKVLSSNLELTKKSNKTSEQLSSLKSTAFTDRTNTLRVGKSLKNAQEEQKKPIKKVNPKKNSERNPKEAKPSLARCSASSPTVKPAQIKTPPKKKNISIEDVEKLLNNDDDDLAPPVTNSSKRQPADESDKPSQTEKSTTAATKKFFKYKHVFVESSQTKSIKPTTIKKAPQRRVVRSDSPYNPHLKSKPESSSPTQPSKSLRVRALKNYCEISRLLDSPQKKPSPPSSSSSSNDCNKDEGKKGLPVYKSARLSQEAKDGEAIYDFPFDWQDNGQTKPKKIAKKPRMKRPKKAAVQLLPKAQLSKKKITQKPAKTVRFEQQVQPAAAPEEVAAVEAAEATNPPTTNPPLEEPLVASIQEAPTILSHPRILSDVALANDLRIDLIATPKILPGDKPNKPYLPKSMANHSLIRESMSPIVRASNKFDSGSPWRAGEDFCRVRRMVQSTPQPRDNKLSWMRDESGEETLSSTSKVENKVARKFGTEISNLSLGGTLGKNNRQSAVLSKSGTPLRKFGTEISNLSLGGTLGKSNRQSVVMSKSGSPLRKESVGKTALELSGVGRSGVGDAAKSGKAGVGSAASSLWRDLLSSTCKYGASTAEKTIAATAAEPEPGPSWLDKPPIAPQQSQPDDLSNVTRSPDRNDTPPPAALDTEDTLDEVHLASTPGKKPPRMDELNVDNAFGFDDDDDSGSLALLEELKATPPIAAALKVVDKKKKKVVARKTAAAPSRVSLDMVKQALLKATKKTTNVEVANNNNNNNNNHVDIFGEPSEINMEEFDSASENKENIEPKKAAKEAASEKARGSDRKSPPSGSFDLSDDSELSGSSIVDDQALFADLPVNFQEAPRRSYCKRKQNQVRFAVNDKEIPHSDNEEDRPRPKKKKESKLSREKRKQMEMWVKSTNETFEEIENFSLVVE